jgi:hypothetical protein
VDAFVVAGAGEEKTAVPKDGERREAAVVALPVAEVGVRDGPALKVRLGSIDGDQFAGMRQRDGVQQHGVHDGEQRGVDADSERQSDDNYQGKAGRLAQLAQREAEVLHEIFEPRQRVTLAHGLLRLLHAAKADERLTASLFGSHPGAQIVLDVHLKMALQLGGEVFVRAPCAKQTTKADPQRSEGAHYASSAGERKRATMAAACSQLRASRSSCFRPARVSR